MLKGTFVMPLMLADSGRRGWRFSGRIPLILHIEFLFRRFRGRNARFAVHRGAL
jgi:hypothetical protein